MCWITKNKKCITKNIAKNDILVHKIVQIKDKEVQNKFLSWSNKEKEVLSYWKQFRYKMGKTYELDHEIIVEPLRSLEGKFFASIKDGFHSYSKDCPISRDCLLTVGEAITQYLGVFSKDSSFKRRIATYSNCRIMECVILKGSEYYENEYGEIVSNQLKPISVEKI